MPLLVNRSRRKSRRRVTQQTTVLGKVTGVVATPVDGLDEFDLSWDALAGANKYRVYQSREDDLSDEALIATVSDPEYNDASISDNDPVYWRIAGINDTVVPTAVGEFSDPAESSLPATGGAGLTIGTTTTYRGYYGASIAVAFLGDSWDQQGTATVELSDNAGVDYVDIDMPMRFRFRRVAGTVKAATNTTLVWTSGGNDGAELGAIDDRYVGYRVKIVSGGASNGQVRTVTAYLMEGSGAAKTRTLTVAPAWSTNPSLGDTYILEEPSPREMGINLMHLTPGQAYRARITVAHPDGVNGINPIIVNFTTKIDTNVVAVADLLTENPSLVRYIRADGADEAGRAATSNTAGSAWRTPGYARQRWIEAGSPAWVISAGAGRYQCRELPGTGKLVFVGTNAPINTALPHTIQSNRTIFEYGLVTGPIGGDAPFPGAWIFDNLTDGGGVNRTFYRCTVPTSSVIGYLGWGATYDDTPEILAEAAFGEKLPSNAMRLEWCYRNRWFRHWWFRDATDPNTIIIPQLPPTCPNSNPNNLYMTFGIGNGFNITAGSGSHDDPSFRICNIEMRGYQQAISIRHPAKFVRCDNVLISGSIYGIWFDPVSTPSPVYATDCVFNNVLMRDSGLRAQPGQSFDGYIPWKAVKGKVPGDVTGMTIQESTIGRVGAGSEGAAVRGHGQQNCHYIMFEVDGIFNGIGGGGANQPDRFGSAGTELHNCYFQNIADDCFGETEKDCPLLRVSNVRTDYCSTVTSWAEGQWGPQTFSNITIHWGNQEIAEVIDEPGNKGVGYMVAKVGGGNFPQNSAEFINITAWTNETFTRFMHKSNSGSPGDQPDFHFYNCVLRTPYRIINDGDNGGFTSDYIYMAATDGTRVQGNAKHTTAAWRTAVGGNTHSNKVDPANTGSADQDLEDTGWLDDQLTAPATGDFTPVGGSIFLNAGQYIRGYTPDWQTDTTPNIGSSFMLTGTFTP